MAKEKPAGGLSKAVPKGEPVVLDGKRVPSGPVHSVLYMRYTENGEERPLISRELGDPNADDDFRSEKVAQVGRSITSGASRPLFRLATEQNGVEVEI